MSALPESHATEAHEPKAAHARPRKKHSDPPPFEASKEMWLISFADLLSLLLCFFIMLLTFSAQDKRRERAAIGSLMGAFGILPDGVGFDDTGSYMATVEHISLRDEVILFAAFEAMLEDESWKTLDVKVYVDDEGRRRIRFNDRVLFRVASSELDPHIFPLLDRLGAILRTLERGVIVEGHTDQTLAGGSRGAALNFRLSAERAAAVVRYLEEAARLDPSRISGVGYGATRPLVGDDQPGDANRRVEVVVQ